MKGSELTCVQGHSSHAENFNAECKYWVEADSIGRVRTGILRVLCRLQGVADAEIYVHGI